MIIVLLGASGSGKSTIENELATHHVFEKDYFNEYGGINIVTIMWKVLCR